MSIVTVITVLMGRHTDHWERVVKPTAFLEKRRYLNTRKRHDLLPQPASVEWETKKMRPVNPLSPNHGPTALKSMLQVIDEAHQWVSEHYPIK